jgi:tRNA(fMet)-specific endonuclease VapC
VTVYLLDTNTCVHYLRKRNQHVIRRIRARPRREVCLCSVVLGELFYGAYKSPQAFRAANFALLARFCPRFASRPFDNAAADVFGRLRAYLESLGTPIGPYDLQIAAIALVHGLTLVTHNVAEFSRVPGLTIEDWEIP